MNTEEMIQEIILEEIGWFDWKMNLHGHSALPAIVQKLECQGIEIDMDVFAPADGIISPERMLEATRVPA